MEYLIYAFIGFFTGMYHEIFFKNRYVSAITLSFAIAFLSSLLYSLIAPYFYKNKDDFDFIYAVYLFVILFIFLLLLFCISAFTSRHRNNSLKIKDINWNHLRIDYNELNKFNKSDDINKVIILSDCKNTKNKNINDKNDKA